MSKSPERYCLGGLMKDIEKELSIDDLDNSNEGTSYKSSQEKRFFSNDTYFPQFSTFFSPSLENINLFSKSKGSEPEKEEEEKQMHSKFSQKYILECFNSQKETKQLQKSLGEEPKEIIDEIIKELKGIFRTVIMNKNGNYFCSDLLKVCTQEQRIEILKELSPFISEDCTHEFGTHPIQNLIELSSSEEEYKLLLFSFNDYNKVLLASLNQNGSFVIQKLIVNIPEKIRIQFNQIFVQFICILSRDMYGLCAVKKFIGYTRNELIVKQIFNTIIKNFVSISSNQYGNYLIQYLLEKWWKTPEGVYLKKIIVSKFQILSGNHYSSYICRLFFKLCNNEEKKEFLSNLNNMKTLKGGSQQTKMPMLNKFIFDEKDKKEINDKKEIKEKNDKKEINEKKEIKGENKEKNVNKKK